MAEVIAMAGISAAEREVVETVRVHILPMEVTEFVTESGDSIMVGGPDIVPDYHSDIVADMAARGDTFIPQLVEHAGPAVGMVRAAELDADGIYLVVDLWTEGVAARFGRDFVSAYWRFGEVGADGRPRSARIVENSFTPTPQFSLAQKPVSELETVQDENHALFPIAATMRAPAPSTPNESNTMTIEETLEQLVALDGFAEAVREIAGAMAAESEEEAEPAPEAEAMDGEPAKEEEEAAASEDGAGVAASDVVRALDAIANRLERVEKSTAVAASLRGQHSSTASTGPAPGVSYLVDRLEKGVGLDQAIDENRNLTQRD